MSFEWPENPYPKMNANLTLSASHTAWNQCQEADKAAIESYLGCSVEEAKKSCDQARLKDEWNKGFDKWVGEKGG